MIKVYRNILWILSPWVLMALVEALILPSDQFTFRAWEAIKVNLLARCLPGPFYPNIHKIFMEAGDAKGEKIKNRKNLWITDIYGHRNEILPNLDEVYGLIVGDSNIAGASMDQADLLSTVLQKKTGKLWINLAYEYKVPWEHPICKQNLPKWIVFQMKRGSLLNLPNLGGRTSDPRIHGNFEIISKIDHATKLAFLNKVRSWFGCKAIAISEQLQNPHLSIPLARLELLLSGGNIPRKMGIYEKFSHMTPSEILIQHQEKCDSMGIFFILVVLPDTVQEADSLIRQIAQSGVWTIGFLGTTEFPRGANLDLFWQKDDSHWTKLGTQQTADKIVSILKKVGNLNKDITKTKPK